MGRPQRCRVPWRVISLALATALCPNHAAARRVRPLFEPSDLELEGPGTIEGDFQFGVVRGEQATRMVVPDLEIDVGLLPFLELDIDGSYAIEGCEQGPFTFDHAAPDNLWLAAKLGFYAARDPAAHTALALGVQLGPKLPVAVAAHGVGIEALFLAATTYESLQLVWNAGGFVDSAPDRTPARPSGFEVGVDASVEFAEELHVSAIGCLSFVHFRSQDADQLLASTGLAWSVIDDLDLSLLGMLGVLSGGDHYGVLLGVAPKLHLFE